ncbi:MAG: ABC transporter ATP-binding protein [Desulfurococcaceae archaeon]
MKCLLELRNVSKIFKTGILGKGIIKAVDDVSLRVEEGNILGLLGESGSGKSTIARLILKMTKPTKGVLLFKGVDIWKIKDIDYYRRVQGVFQDPFSSFNPRRKVSSAFYDVIRNYYGHEKFNNEDKLIEFIKPVIESIGLSFSEILDRYPHEFSGGQLQRLSIARSLLVQPELLVADEPVSMIDASTRIDILNIFIDLKREKGLTSIIISHDLALTSYVSDKVAVLYKGQVVEDGPSDILLDPLHPYTKMLSEAIPRLEKKWKSPLSYGVETTTHLYDLGCVFAPRCPHRMEICLKQNPPYVNIDKSRVKCWLYVSK